MGATEVYIGNGMWSINGSISPPIPATGVSIDQNNSTINIGAGLALTATVAPPNATNQNVTWSSSASSVASIAPNGLGALVTGITAGATTITATDSAGHTDTIVITVEAVSTAITPVVSSNRSSGVAPLSVFFDATLTTALATTRPFHDLEYRWNFGDNDTVTWSRGMAPGTVKKNRATGANTAHVYETPGTYTPSVTITDGTNTVTHTMSPVVVGNPDTVFAGVTTYVSTGTDFAGARAGETYVTSNDFSAALANALAAGAKQVLFKKGDAFNAASLQNFAATGPVLIGSWGSGARPTILCTNNNAVFQSSTAIDWRLVDLDISGNAFATGSGGVVLSGTAADVTLLRVSSNATAANGFSMQGTRIAIADSSSTNIAAGSSGALGIWAVDVFGFALLGSLIDNGGGGEYNMRVQGGRFETIIGNTFGRCGDGKMTVTFRGDETQTTYITQYLQITDNLIDASTSVNVYFIVGIQPQNSERNERISDVIFERNKIVSCPNGMELLTITARDVTARNNLLDCSNSTFGPAVSIRYSNNLASLPAVKNVHVYQNTFISTTAGSLTAVAIYNQGLAVEDTIVKDNFLYAPLCIHDGGTNGDKAIFISDEGVRTIASNNSTDDQGKTASPNLVTWPPVALSDWALAAGCYGIGAGSLVPVWSDIVLKGLTAASTRNLGAWQ